MTPGEPTPERFDTPTLQQLLATSLFGQHLSVIDVTTSTNDVVKALARQGAPEGTVLIADHQTQGRGRYGRTFMSPPGVGIYLSLLLRPEGEVNCLPQLTLVMGIAAAEALVAYSALPVRLKWPNDLEIQHKKIAGILCEAVLSASSPPAVVIGIGINVNTTLEDLPVELHPHVTSLALAAGHPWPRGPLVAALLQHFERWYRVFQQGESATIVQTWLQYGPIIGRQVRYPHEPHIEPGVVLGLDDDGALRVQQPAGEQRRVIAGEVVFL